MDQKALAYFSSINPLARKIIQDEQVLKEMVDGWGELDWQKQEELLDNYMVDMSIRKQYEDIEKEHHYPASFPSLKVETGEKIIVDFENDCWTWQDEHSSPFSWKTKSQQDLTLLDLEPEQLAKPPSKSSKRVKEHTPPTATHDQIPLAPREFSVEGGSIWESPFLVGMKKPEYLNRSQSQSPEKSSSNSRESVFSREKSPEEVNYAFTGSRDDLSGSDPSTLDTDRSPSVSSTEILASSRGSSPEKKSVTRKRSFSKSPKKTSLSSRKESENGHVSLVKKGDMEDHAFDNPALGNDEWSSFVNEDRADSVDSNTASPYRKPLLREPGPVVLDRGDNPQAGDQSRLLTGPQADYTDEVLVVTRQISRQDSSLDKEQLDDSSIPRTGFGFLDDW